MGSPSSCRPLRTTRSQIPSAAQRAFHQPHIYNTVISFLPPSYAKGVEMLTLNGPAYERTVSQLYRTLDLATYLHLIQEWTPEVSCKFATRQMEMARRTDMCSRGCKTTCHSSGTSSSIP